MNERTRTNDPTELLDAVRADPRYLANLEWGKPRRGHPEGTLRAHIEELERHLDTLAADLGPERTARVRLLIHVHDTFKPDAQPGVGIEHPRSHASLAAAFLSEFTDDADLVAMVQWHDVPYALWRKWMQTGRLDEDRLARLREAIDDWDTFLPFLVVDNGTAGKSREPLNWFLELVE